MQYVIIFLAVYIIGALLIAFRDEIGVITKRRSCIFLIILIAAFCQSIPARGQVSTYSIASLSHSDSLGLPQQTLIGERSAIRLKLMDFQSTHAETTLFSTSDLLVKGRPRHIAIQALSMVVGVLFNARIHNHNRFDPNKRWNVYTNRFESNNYHTITSPVQFN